MVIALDLSTKTGWASFRNGKLDKYGTIFLNQTVEAFGPYPYNYIEASKKMASMVFDKITELEMEDPNDPITDIVIEETNASKQNYTQKIVEYVHYSVVQMLNDILCLTCMEIHYIRTGEWRKITGANKTKEEKSLNAKVSREKAKIRKKIEAEQGKEAAEKARILAKIDGHVVGKVTPKHQAIRAVKEIYGLDFQMKENDAVDAILVGTGFLRGAPLCDGTPKGKRENTNARISSKDQKAI